MVERNAWMETKITLMIIKEECWTIDGKKTRTRLAMADQPAKNELELLPD